MSHQKYQSCIDACNECADACDHCATACLDESDPGKMADCIATDIDCAIVCRIAAGFMARGSGSVERICELCADLCEKCATECEKHEHAHCQDCAKACRRCAEECRRMTSAVVA